VKKNGTQRREGAKGGDKLWLKGLNIAYKNFVFLCLLISREIKMARKGAKAQRGK